MTDNKIKDETPCEKCIHFLIYKDPKCKIREFPKFLPLFCSDYKKKNKKGKK